MKIAHANFALITKLQTITPILRRPGCRFTKQLNRDSVTRCIKAALESFHITDGTPETDHFVAIECIHGNPGPAYLIYIYKSGMRNDCHSYNTAWSLTLISMGIFCLSTCLIMISFLKKKISMKDCSIHWGWITDIYVMSVGHYSFRMCLATCAALRHYLTEIPAYCYFDHWE